MRTKILSSMRALWRRRSGAAGRHPIGLTPFEQSQRSWARALRSYADVPVPYGPFFEPLQAAGAPFPITVIAPTYEGFLHREAEKLICATRGEVTVLERRGNRLDTRRYPIPRITCVEVISVLLDSRITIMGQEGDSLVPSASILRFNAVTDFLYAPILTRIREGAEASKGTPGAEPDPFKEWGKQYLKFMNYARRSLLGDETVAHAVLQPEILLGVVSVFGRTYGRTISPTHATILTDRELITIREIQYKGARTRYGGVWTYIPLRRIESLSLTEGHYGLVALRVQLPGGGHVQLQFEPSARDDLQTLVEKSVDLKERISGNATTGAPPLG